MTTARTGILLLICCLTVMAIVLSPELGVAGEESELEEIIDGFDDSDEAGDDLQEVIEGFDDIQKDDVNNEDNTDDLSEEEVLEGFDEESTVSAPVESRKPQLPSFLNLDGYLKLSSTYNLHSNKAEGTDTDWGGLSSLKTEIKLELDAKLPASWQARIAGHAFYDFAFRIDGRNEYEDEVLDQYEKEIELGEAWLLGSLTPDLDLKTGRQIEVWGRSENIRITDVLNPLNLRVPGLTDIENLRLPVTMTKLEYFFAGLSLSGIAIHEKRFPKNPKFGSDFFPAPSRQPGRSSDKGLTFDDTQFAVELNGIFHRWDASLYAADIYDDFAYFDVAAIGIPPRIERKHARIKMLGGAGNIAWGNWLFIAEAAFFDDLRFSNRPGKEYSRLDVLIGLEYSGFQNTTIAVDIANQHIFDYDNILKDEPDRQREDLIQSAMRLTRTFMNDTLSFTFLANTFGATGDQGAFQRFTLEYDLTDSIEITGGAVFYNSGDLRRTQSIGSNDRLYLEIQYNF